MDKSGGRKKKGGAINPRYKRGFEKGRERPKKSCGRGRVAPNLATLHFALKS